MNWMRYIKTSSRLHWLSCIASGSMLLVTTGCHSLGQQSNPDYDSNAVSNESSNYDFEVDASEEISGHKKDKMKRYPDIGKCAIPAPLGTYVNGWNDAQICSARHYDFVISRYEWFSGGDQLGPDGQWHVIQIAKALPGCTEHVILEAEPVELRNRESLNAAQERTSALNEQRKQTVIMLLAENGVADAEQRVFVAPIDRVGVHGVEAPRIYNQLLRGGFGRGGQQGGFGRGGFGGGGFGAGGGGFGGGFF